MSGKLLKGLKSKADGSVKAPAKDTPVAAPAKEDAPSAKRKEAPKDEFPWESVGATDTGVRSALKEVEAFWTHGTIAADQVQVAKVRTRGTRKTKTNTDYEIDVKVSAVVYKCHIKGEGDPDIRCPVKGRVWVTQPCVVCLKDDNEDTLLLCGTDDPEAPFAGCEQSFHIACVGLKKVPEDDWFCKRCREEMSKSK